MTRYINFYDLDAEEAQAAAGLGALKNINTERTKGVIGYIVLSSIITSRALKQSPSRVIVEALSYDDRQISNEHLRDALADAWSLVVFSANEHLVKQDEVIELLDKHRKKRKGCTDVLADKVYNMQESALVTWAIITDYLTALRSLMLHVFKLQPLTVPAFLQAGMQRSILLESYENGQEETGEDQ